MPVLALSAFAPREGQRRSLRYVEVIIRRWQEFAGGVAVREVDGVKFDELAA